MKKILLTILIILTSCSSAKINPAFLKQSINRVAILPIKSPNNLVREKNDLLTQALSDELSANGYIILDHDLVNQYCNESDCGDNKTFADKYNLQAYIKLENLSVNRINALIGHYNKISGTLKIISPENIELGIIKNEVSERGGILFNSGQVIQGFVSATENKEISSFRKLSNKFAKVLIERLPKYKKEALQITEINIKDITVTPEGAFGRYKLCLHGNADLQAFLLIDSHPASLQEISSGKYCGIFPLGGNINPNSNLKVKLESPFGITKEIGINPIQTCKINKLNSLDFNISSCQNSNNPILCQEIINACRNTKLLVFKGLTDVGPYENTGSKKINDVILENNTQILALNQDGGTSLLTLLKEQK